MAEVDAARRVGDLQKNPPVAAKVPRVLKQRAIKGAEDGNKAKVRKRDGYCRFPLCGCKAFKLRLEVSHAEHKGAGGNPKGDRSTPDKLIYLCVARHQANRIAVDRGTLRWRPLTKRGSAGPVAWFVDVRGLDPLRLELTPKWVEVARETARHVYAPITAPNRVLLEQLATMIL